MSDIVEFPIHFNTEEHLLRADDFVAFTKDLEKIGQEFGKNVFGKRAFIQIYVLPPEEGTFLGKWGIGLVVMTGVWNGLDADITKSFVKGLTGNEPSYYAEMAGTNSKNGALLIRDATRSFLEKIDTETTVPQQSFPDSYGAKNDFYRKCLENKDIKSIGFTCEEEFPIERGHFPKYILNLEGSLDLKPDHQIHQLLIASSVNTLDSNAQWRLQDTKTKRFLYARLKDSQFQARFLAGEFPIKLTERDDVITAMVEYNKQLVDGEVRIIERDIIKVYKFNNDVIDDIPVGSMISAVDKVKAGASSKQASLLDSIQHP
ncbi:MAG: hypothetical protein WBP40_00640 [Candidatus Moraniibacteriota bacterium]